MTDEERAEREHQAELAEWQAEFDRQTGKVAEPLAALQTDGVGRMWLNGAPVATPLWPYTVRYESPQWYPYGSNYVTQDAYTLRLVYFAGIDSPTTEEPR